MRDASPRRSVSLATQLLPGSHRQFGGAENGAPRRQWGGLCPMILDPQTAERSVKCGRCRRRCLRPLRENKVAGIVVARYGRRVDVRYTELRLRFATVPEIVAPSWLLGFRKDFMVLRWRTREPRVCYFDILREP